MPYYAAGLVERYELIPPGVLEVADVVDIVPCSDVSIGGKYAIVRGREYFKPRLLLVVWPLLPEGNVINLLRPEDAESLKELLLSDTGELTVIGGLAALPVVDALVTASYRTSLAWDCTEFDSDISSVLCDDLQRAGVKLLADLPSPQQVRVAINYGEGRPPPLPFDLQSSSNRIRVDSGCRLSELDAYALGLSTEIVEPEGRRHAVRCEEETLLQAMNFAACAVEAPFPPLRRYFVARFQGRVYASFGLTMSEAESAGYEPAATRIRGWGKSSNILLKAIASREGQLIGVQVVAGEEDAWMLGLLYSAVLARIKVCELSRALSPVDLKGSAFGNVFSKAFAALLRKTTLNRLARSMQRLR